MRRTRAGVNGTMSFHASLGFSTLTKRTPIGARWWPRWTLSAAWVRPTSRQARKALGPESWRLERDREDIVLDLDGAYLDLDKAIDAASAVASSHMQAEIARNGALAQLLLPGLPAWTHEDWVVEANDFRLATVERLHRNTPDGA